MKIKPVNEVWPNTLISFKDTGSNSENEIFLSVGKAISKWERVESTLGIIFGHLIESDSIAARRAYGSISNVSGKDTALLNAAEVFHDRHHKFPFDTFKELMKYYRNASGYRNKIAHGLVIHFNINDESRGYFLAPSFYSSKNRKAETMSFWNSVKESNDDFEVFGCLYRYTHEDIEYISAKFEELNETLNNFLNELMKDKLKKLFRGESPFMPDIKE